MSSDEDLLLGEYPAKLSTLNPKLMDALSQASFTFGFISSCLSGSSSWLKEPPTKDSKIFCSVLYAPQMGGAISLYTYPKYSASPEQHKAVISHVRFSRSPAVGYPSFIIQFRSYSLNLGFQPLSMANLDVQSGIH